MSSRWRLALAIAACCTPPIAWAQAAASVPAAAEAGRILTFEVVVNGSKGGMWPLLDRAGVLYAPVDALQEWRIATVPQTPLVRFRGSDYFALSAVPGYVARVDPANQALELTFSAQAFAATRLTREPVATPATSPVLPSAFLNYDFSYTAAGGRDASTARELGLLTEVGASNAAGVVTSSFAARNLLSSTDAGAPRRVVRLETTLTRDEPSANRTLRLGDSATRAGMWGHSVYFGGVQWGSNFALAPGFVSQALPTVAGVSTAPSTVELYVNDVLRQVSNVPAGPFAIESLPTLGGSGEARLVVRDLLGRETVISQRFITSSRLLAPGLDDWSAEVGKVRRDLGDASGHYGDAFAAGWWRRGISNALTVEGRADTTRSATSAGLGAVIGTPMGILVHGGLAQSRHASLGNGRLWLAGAEWQGTRFASSVQAQGASARFRQLGDDVTVAPERRQLAGSASYSSAGWGTFGAGYVRFERQDGTRVTTVSANYSARIADRITLAITASRVLAGAAGGAGSAVSASLIIPLDGNRVVTSTVARRGNRSDAYATASQNPGYDGHVGWRVLAGQQSSERRAEAGAYYIGQYGRLSADASSSAGQNALRLGATGGLVAADGHLFATTRIDDSFAVAEVAGYGNVGMGLGSHMFARTEADGVALIPRLVPYTANYVRIDPQELPMSAEVRSIEQTVVPAWRSAVKVNFPVRSGRGALIRLVTEDGQPAPPGSLVRIEGDEEDFYVARRGEAYVTGLKAVNTLRVTLPSGRCFVRVQLPEGSLDDILRLGPLACKEKRN